MKVLCSSCEAAEASVLCCADEAALCARCDREVHAANRLAGKHQRVPLLAPGGAAVLAPKCDICQECQAYFFCLEDRALLCRSCDVAVHTANAFVSAHRRFLLTGVQVGLEVTDQAADPPDAGPVPLPASPSPTPKKSNPATLYNESAINWDGPDVVGITGTLPDWSVLDEQFSSPVGEAGGGGEQDSAETVPARAVAAAGSPAVFGGQGGMAGGMTDWPLDEFFGFSDFNGGFGFADNGTSKQLAGRQCEARKDRWLPELPVHRRGPELPGALWPGAGDPLFSAGDSVSRAGTTFPADGFGPPLAKELITSRCGSLRRQCGIRTGHMLAGEPFLVLHRRPVAPEAPEEMLTERKILVNVICHTHAIWLQHIELGVGHDLCCNCCICLVPPRDFFAGDTQKQQLVRITAVFCWFRLGDLYNSSGL